VLVGTRPGTQRCRLAIAVALVATSQLLSSACTRSLKLPHVSVTWGRALNQITHGSARKAVLLIEHICSPGASCKSTPARHVQASYLAHCTARARGTDQILGTLGRSLAGHSHQNAIKGRVLACLNSARGGQREGAREGDGERGQQEEQELGKKCAPTRCAAGEYPRARVEPPAASVQHAPHEELGTDSRS